MFAKTQKYLKLLLLNSLLFSTLNGAAVTYELSGGRFGDNLLAYSHAKWIEFRYNIPILIKTFEFCDQLVLYNSEKHISSFSFTEKFLFSSNNLDIDTTKNCLYSVPYFSEVLEEHHRVKSWIYFPVNWDDPLFKSQIKQMIYPIDKTLLNIELPKNRISVALHIRNGGGYDEPNVHITDPLKFPPLSFYIDQIKNLSSLVNNKNLYIFVFTDNSDPKKIVSEIKNKLNDYKNIIFDYRKTNNAHNKNVLKDFFSMIKFNCLIRPESNFSIMAGKIANYAIEIFPANAHIQNNSVYIDQVKINYKK